MYWKKVSDTEASQSGMPLIQTRSFAWMEMMKTLATVFRLFNFVRSTTSVTELREGFFVKAKECWIEVERRH